MHAIIIYRKVLCCHTHTPIHTHTRAVVRFILPDMNIYAVGVLLFDDAIDSLASLLFVARICIALAGIHWCTTTHRLIQTSSIHICTENGMVKYKYRIEM